MDEEHERRDEAHLGTWDKEHGMRDEKHGMRDEGRPLETHLGRVNHLQMRLTPKR